MRYLLKNGKKIYYEIHGEGEPLVILNGIMMSTKSWSEFIEPLSKNNQLILIDFLDQGQSDKLEAGYNHSLQVESTMELLNEITTEPIHLFGISYGGEIAIQIALNYPDRIKKLLLFNTCSETSYWLEEVGNAWNKATEDPEAYYLTTIPFIYSPMFFTKNKEWMEKRKKVLIPIFSDQHFIQSMIRLTDSSVDYNITARLGEITIPTLIVGAEYDFVTPFYQQKELHQGISSSELVFIPDSGHGIMYEKPVLFTSLIKGFVQPDKTNYNI